VVAREDSLQEAELVVIELQG